MKFYFDKKPIDKILHQIRYCRVCTTTFFVPVVCADTSLVADSTPSLSSNIFSIYSLIIILLLVAAGITLFWVQKQRFKHLNNIKFFYSNICKLLRSPVSNLVSQLRTISSSEELSDQQKSLLNYMLGNASRLLRLSDIISDLGSHNHNIVAEKTDLVNFVSDICNGFAVVANQQGIGFKINSSVPSYNAYIDREKIDTALYIILSDYFSYIPSGKNIEILIDSDNGNLQIKLCESESGYDINLVADLLNTKTINHLQSDLSNQYAAILFLSHIIVMHHGSVSVSSYGSNGIQLSITLTNGAELKSEESSTKFEHLKPLTLPKGKNILRVSGDGKDGGTETVLIVDSDNNILNYLSALLSPLYNVETASNGKTGLDKAIATMPDLIITEIPMPKMDGLTMCRSLKDNIDTCHIPVVVLSVNDSVQSRIECAESGGDLFIAKPFDFKYLSLMVNKLLNQRKMLRKKYCNESLLPEGSIPSLQERDLLTRVTAVINKRLSDPNLNVETLSEEIGMSRGHFQRKFKAITGQNPNEYIRTIRLNTAADLLLNKDISIKEIADVTGFGSQSYFCTLFLKQFNISPKQYRSQGHSKEE